jgi:hypothetical protein
MKVKASYGVRLKSAQAWGCPCSINVYSKRHKVSSNPFFVLTLLLLEVSEISRLLEVSEISRQMHVCSTNRRDLPHSVPFPFVMGGIADYGVDFILGFSSV